MAQFTSVSYSGSYSGSGQGSDPIYGSYTVVASGTLTAILSQDVAGNVSGTWSYSGSTTSTGSFGSETTPVSDSGDVSGDVSGTAASLSFTSNHGVFVNGIGQLTNGDTLITASATFVFDGGSGGASGSMTGYPPAEAQVITGTDGNDILTGGAGNDSLDGGAGIDAARYTGNRAGFTFAQSGANFIVTGEGVDTVTNVERLVFADTKIALDVIGGNAGTAAKILGITVGAANATNPTYMGIILSYLDSGTSYADLMEAVLSAIGATTPTAAATLLLTNILDAAPPADLLATCVSLIDSGAYSVGSFGALAADYNADKTAHINLVGLAQTGIEFA